jgi:hypothetical protein
MEWDSVVFGAVIGVLNENESRCRRCRRSTEIPGFELILGRPYIIPLDGVDRALLIRKTGNEGVVVERSKLSCWIGPEMRSGEMGLGYTHGPQPCVRMISCSRGDSAILKGNVWSIEVRHEISESEGRPQARVGEEIDGQRLSITILRRCPQDDLGTARPMRA